MGSFLLLKDINKCDVNHSLYNQLTKAYSYGGTLIQVQIFY